MKSLLLLTLLFPAVLSGASMPDDQLMYSLSIKITDVSPSGTITLELANSSKKPLRLFQEANSWGAEHWRILLMRNGRLEVFSQSPYQLFTVNNPTYDEIPGEGHIGYKLDLNGGNWCGLHYCGTYMDHGFGAKKIGLEPNDTVFVVYDVPYTTEAHKLNVWYGVAATFTVVRQPARQPA